MQQQPISNRHTRGSSSVFFLFGGIWRESELSSCLPQVSCGFIRTHSAAGASAAGRKQKMAQKWQRLLWEKIGKDVNKTMQEAEHVIYVFIVTMTTLIHLAGKAWICLLLESWRRVLCVCCRAVPRVVIYTVFIQLFWSHLTLWLLQRRKWWVGKRMSLFSNKVTF